MNDEGKKRIMIVDDSAVMLRSMKGILDRTYTVYLSTSGKQALQAIPEKQPDLVLLDYKMPDLDGRAVFEEMQKDEYMKTIPVLKKITSIDIIGFADILEIE